jgi:hypothetical protein
MDILLLAVGALLAASFFLVAARVIARWRGARRVIAIALVVAVIAWVTKIGFDVSADPTSHNLWPFEVAGLVGLALVVLGLVALTGRRSGLTQHA